MRFGCRHRIRRTLACASIPLLASFVTPAFTEEPYVKFETGVSGLKLPSNLFFAERGETSPFARLGDLDTDSGVLAGGHLSLVFGTDLPAPVLGADMSTIEFVGAFQNVWGSTAASFFDNGPGERYGWVEMPYVSGYGTIDGSTLETTTDRTARYIKNQALLKKQVRAR